MTLEQVMAKYLDKMGGAVESAVSLAMQEVPLLIQEYLGWHFYKECIGLFFSLLFLIGMPVISKLWYNYWFKDNGEGARIEYADKLIVMPVTLIGGVVVVSLWLASIFATEGHITKIAQIKIAPKIYIMDQFLERGKK